MSEQVDELRRELAELKQAFAQQTQRQARRRVLGLFSGIAVGSALVMAVQVAAQTGAQTVRAPFTVTNSAGKAIFYVSDDAVEIYGLASGDSLRFGYAKTGASGTAGWGMTVYGKGNKGLAYVGSSGVDTGRVEVAQDNARSWMSGSGIVAVSRDGKNANAAIMLGTSGGKIELANNSGKVMATGGVLDSGVGVFRVHGKVMNYISGEALRLPSTK